MATIEEAVVAKLMATAAITNLIGERLYPQAVPQDAARPAIAYETVDDVPVPSRGTSTLARAVVQLTCQADDYADAKAVANAVRAAFDGWRDPTSDPSIEGALIVNASDGALEVRMANAVVVDVAIWHGI